MKDILGIELKTGDTVVGKCGEALFAGTISQLRDNEGCTVLMEQFGRQSLYEPVQQDFGPKTQMVKVASYGEAGEDQVGVLQDAGQN